MVHGGIVLLDLFEAVLEAQRDGLRA